jgi:hypothetical protein
VMVNAFLRAKGLERSAVPHHPELAVAVSAMVLHGFSRMASQPSRLSRGQGSRGRIFASIVQCSITHCNAQLV